MTHPKSVLLFVILCAAAVAAQNPAQTSDTGAAADKSAQDATLRITARAVLVDVIVTDRSGKPVTGLTKDAFSVKEDGKDQPVSYFEEHRPNEKPLSVEIPRMPTDVFTNFSPFPQPPAVNVLLFDSLNTTIDNQSWVHKQALNFLKSAKPGQRMAIFTMGLGLHFIQGFNDDPSVLLTAIENKKNNDVESSVMIKGQAESTNQQNLVAMMSAPELSGRGNVASAAPPEAIEALQRFITENDNAQSNDRIYLTLENLQRLAAFLNGFPGRKNVIWFAEKVPTFFIGSGSTFGSIETGNPALGETIKRTLAMLAAARVAIYPVDPRGAEPGNFYTADRNLPRAYNSDSQVIGGPSNSSGSSTASGYFNVAKLQETQDRDSDQNAAKLIAEDSGGRAYANMNKLSDLIERISAESGNFYTVSYRPTNSKMDGLYRKIEVKAPNGYSLSYRRGYFAVDEAIPGNALAVRNEEVQRMAAKNPGAVDPLLPFMMLGMPQSEQILYKVRVTPQAPAAQLDQPKVEPGYKIDFALDATDLDLRPAADGTRKDSLNVSMIVFDRYGNVVTRKDHRVELNLKPEAYAEVSKVGVQLHAQIPVQKGNYWLRTGIFDRTTGKVGTMEIPLSAVVPLETAAKEPPK